MNKNRIKLVGLENRQLLGGYYNKVSRGTKAKTSCEHLRVELINLKDEKNPYSDLINKFKYPLK